VETLPPTDSNRRGDFTTTCGALGSRPGPQDLDGRRGNRKQTALRLQGRDVCHLLPVQFKAICLRWNLSVAKAQTVQDLFLGMLQREGIAVSVYLTNGIRLQGEIVSFDHFSMLLGPSRVQFVYKTAIASVVPLRE
jgi:host factor-I protein